LSFDGGGCGADHIVFAIVLSRLEWVFRERAASCNERVQLRPSTGVDGARGVDTFPIPLRRRRACDGGIPAGVLPSSIRRRRQLQIGYRSLPSHHGTLPGHGTTGVRSYSNVHLSSTRHTPSRAPLAKNSVLMYRHRTLWMSAVEFQSRLKSRSSGIGKSSCPSGLKYTADRFPAPFR
jgi:hypothetical protein